MIWSRKRLATSLFLITLIGCDSESTGNTRPFLQGTFDNPEIALVVNSTGKALTMFQVGNPAEQREIPFGASSAVTPTGLAVRGTYAAVPLGNAASVALVDIAGERIQRFFTMPSGNATGAAFVDNNTLLVANLTDDYVGKVTLDQAAGAVTNTLPVAPAPTAIVVSENRAFVVSGNLDENFAPLGNSIVTAIDPTTMTILEEIETGGTNSSAAAVGPDGKVYVLNTGDYVGDGSVTIINPTTLQAEATIPGFGPGPGAIRIDSDGLAYVSGFFTGTLVWNTMTQTFVRAGDNPVCARQEQAVGQPCRGAFDADRSASGQVYQAFFGSPSESLPPYIFIFAPNTYELVDSVSAGVGPAAIQIVNF